MSGIDKLTINLPGIEADALRSKSQDTTNSKDAAKLKDSACQFEALLIGQMLRSARESGASWFGAGEDEASSSAVGMAEEHLAQALTAGGGLGLSRMIADGLARDQQTMEAKKREPIS